LQRPRRRHIDIAAGYPELDFGGALERLGDALELDQKPVARRLMIRPGSWR
jgi:hypothetical protein